MDNNPCGFVIVVQVYGTIHYQLFFDKNGQITRLHAIYGPVKEFWSANGKSLKVQISGPIHDTVVADTYVYETYVGTNEIITVPGYGRVYGWAGNTTYIWDYTTDPWTFIGVENEVGAPFIENWDAICVYLAP